MTIDHVAAYGSTMFSFLPLDLFRIIGRIAAPLFMFALVNGLMHTRSKKRFMLRLYIADLITVAVFTPGMLTGYMSAPRILPTYLYVAIYCFLIEKAADKFKSKRASGLLYIAAVAAVTVIPVLIDQTVIDWMCATVNHSSDNMWDAITLRLILRAILPNIWTIDGSPLFVLMGVIWYFARNKYACAGILALFSIISYLGTYRFPTGYFIDFFYGKQYMMILAAIFIILYNGQRGNGKKWFFYAYYPLHVFLIQAAENIFISFS